MHQKMVLAYDLGGTKLAVGIVDYKGKIIAQIREKINAERGKTTLLNQMTQIGKKFLKNFPEVKKIGIASAGPLDPTKGILLDPTNLKTNKKGWGIIPIVSYLKKKLNLPTFLENDAAAAMLAEKWIGGAKHYSNAMILTLGTGVGIGTLCNGSLVRSGRYLHPEASHLIIHANDQNALCGCGNFGCLEAYLSGTGFTQLARKKFNLKNLTAEKIAEQARKGNKKAIEAFYEYSENLAISIHSFVMLYAPEVIFFTGSFAQAGDLFIKQTEKFLIQYLKRYRLHIDLLPKLKFSKLKNNACLIGAAFVAFKK